MTGVWRRVADDRALLDAAASCDPTRPADVLKLRRHTDPDRVRVALQLVDARRRASAKFGDQHASRLLADRVGVEQASSLAVARWKAARLREVAGEAPVFDLCCGVGADLIALGETGPAVGIERDPLRCEMAKHNAASLTDAAVVAGAVDSAGGPVRLDGAVVHLDPARRDDDGRRTRRIADAEPGPEVLRAVAAASRAAACKLSPAVDRQEAQALFPDAELGFVSENGRLVQALAWTGEARRNDRSAVALATDPATQRVESVEQLAGSPDGWIEPAMTPGRWLLTVDPSVERAQLVGPLCEQIDAAPLGPAPGLLTRDHAEPPTSRFVTAFRFLDTAPFREAKLRAVLCEHDAGEVEVKTRGGAVDPDLWQKRLAGDGSRRLTVFALRDGAKLRAWVAERVRRLG